MILHSQALLAARVVDLEKANKAASERKQRKRKRIQKGGTLLLTEADDLLAQQDVEAQLERERREGRAQTGVGSKRKTCCKRCRETGHNSRTCTKDIVDTKD